MQGLEQLHGSGQQLGMAAKMLGIGIRQGAGLHTLPAEVVNQLLKAPQLQLRLGDLAPFEGLPQGVVDGVVGFQHLRGAWQGKGLQCVQQGQVLRRVKVHQGVVVVHQQVLVAHGAS